MGKNVVNHESKYILTRTLQLSVHSSNEQPPISHAKKEEYKSLMSRRSLEASEIHSFYNTYRNPMCNFLVNHPCILLRHSGRAYC